MEKHTELFYCYQIRLYYFLRQCGMYYVSEGINNNTKQHYYTFNKQSDLDNKISVWNKVKLMLDEVKDSEDNNG